MRGNKKESIPQGKKYVVIPKKQFEKFLKVQTEWAKSTIGLKRDMRKLVVEEVAKELGDKIDMIEGALRDVIIQKKIFIEKGLITREEIDKKYEELKKKK